MLDRDLLGLSVFTLSFTELSNETRDLMLKIFTLNSEPIIITHISYFTTHISFFLNKFNILTLSFFFLFAEKQRYSLCVGCGAQNHDQYILRVAPDLEWHAACLKCQECRQFLDESCTCFVRDGKTYCKRDYVR